MGNAETAKLITELDLHDKLTGGLARAGAAVGRFGGVAKMGMADVHRGVGQLAGGLMRVGTMAAGMAAGGLVIAAKTAADFGDQMNIINTIAQRTPEELDAIGEGIRGFAAKTGADLSDLTSSYYDLLSAGVQVKDAQGEMELAYKLSRGSLSTTTEAVGFLNSALNAYNLTGKDAGKVADMFAQSVSDGVVHLDQISASIGKVAASAHNHKIGLDEIAAVYGRLTVMAVDPSEAMTQMERAMISISSPNGAMAALEARSHRNYEAIAGQKGLVEAMEQVRIDAGKYGADLYKVMGRQEAYNFLINTTGINLKGYRDELDRIHHSNGALDKQYEKRQQGLKHAVDLVKANVREAFVTFGEGLAPGLEKAALSLTAWLQKHHNDVKQLGKDFGSALAGIDWNTVWAGMETFLGLIKTGYEVIRLIPPQITLAVAGLLGVNKLSGGLFGEGLKNVIGGLAGMGIRGVTNRIPGLNKLTATPVFVTNWEGAGLLGGGGAAGSTGVMGKVGAGLKLLGTVAIAGVSIAALAEQFGTFMQTTAQAQADLQTKADAAGTHKADTALDELRGLNSHLENLGLLEHLGADTFGGKQVVDALQNLSHATATNGKLSADDITQAIDVLRHAQTNALARGNQKVADAIGEDIKTLQARQTAAANRTTAAVTGVKGQVQRGDTRQNGLLSTIAAKPTTVNVTTSTSVSSSISVRDSESAYHTSSRYGFVAQ